MRQRHRIPTVLHYFVRASLILGVVAQNASAQNAAAPYAAAPSLPQPSIVAFDPEMVQEGMCTPTEKGITETTISQQGLTEPSLWLIRDQIVSESKFGKRLIDGWLACPGTGEPNRVDLTVNTQLWSSLDFFDRFEFIKKFGTVTTSYGYNLRVFAPRGKLLAAYTCSFAAQGAESNEIACTSFDQLAKTNFWSPIKSAGGF
ncbi:MAG TPA: hypothetical protein VL134_07775 [Leptolyngbya sp.]|jgi:hypothetical protein|nr:hypothetical protein [Leptolyngbya sp.]